MSTATKVIERPVNFRDWEVRGVLAGRKTTFHLPIRPQPYRDKDNPDYWTRSRGSRYTDTNLRQTIRRERDTGRLISQAEYHMPVAEWLAELCPFKPGMKLFIREAWAPSVKAPKCQVAYRGDGRCYGVCGDGGGGFIHIFHGWLLNAPERGDQLGDTFGRSLYLPWRSSMCMPRWASRLTVEVTEVRAQGLALISEMACEIELGAEPYSLGNGAYGKLREVWDERYKSYKLDSNPWVWVISFRRLP